VAGLGAGAATEVPAMAPLGAEPQVFRVSGISYLHIPALDPQESARFYADVFGWEIRDHPEHPSFTDGTGHVIGAFMANRPVSGESGMLPYIYVTSVDEILHSVSARGGAPVMVPYPEGDLWVATFRDPAGNIVGVWQQGPRS
jgi:uncharacterized protein